MDSRPIYQSQARSVRPVTGTAKVVYLVPSPAQGNMSVNNTVQDTNIQGRRISVSYGKSGVCSITNRIREPGRPIEYSAVCHCVIAVARGGYTSQVNYGSSTRIRNGKC